MAKHHNNITQLDARRAQKKKLNEQQWSQLDEIYQTVAESIVEVASNVNQAIQLLNMVGTNNNAELVITAKGLNRDIEDFTRDLVYIKKRHEGKTGVVKDGDDLALCLSIFQDYTILQDRFKAIIFTPMLTISEFLADASDKIMADAKQQTLPVEKEIPNDQSA